MPVIGNHVVITWQSQGNHIAITWHSQGPVERLERPLPPRYRPLQPAHLSSGSSAQRSGWPNGHSAQLRIRATGTLADGVNGTAS